MALPLNIYQTLVGVTSTSPNIVYTAPVGYTGVVLLGQVANNGDNTERVLLTYKRSTQDNELVPNVPVAKNDVLKLLTGKLFVLSGESLELSSTNGTDLKYTFSILETLN